MEKVENIPKKKSMTPFQKLSCVLSGLLAVVSVIFVYALDRLNVLPATFYYPVLFVVVVFVAILFVLQFWYARKKWSKILITLISICVFFATCVGTYYVLKTHNVFKKVTTRQETVKNEVEVLVMKDSPMTSEELDSKRVGLLNNQTGPDKTLIDDLNNKDIIFETVGFDSVTGLVNALYDSEVDAIILTKASADVLYETALGSEAGSEYSRFVGFPEETKAVYSVEYSTEKKDSTVTVTDLINTPFSILVTGVDSRNGFDEVSRSDANMIVTVNPETHTILLTSIPRDYYIPMACEEYTGCPAGTVDKLTHTGLYGTDTTKATLEELLSMSLNYTLTVNFNAVIQMVDALGGVDIYVEPGMGVERFWTNPDYGCVEGWNHMNGEQALAYARERYAYEDGDKQRIRNQQQVLQAVFDKAISPAILVNYGRLTDAVSGAFITDLNESDIQALIQYQLKESPDWKIITYALDGEGSDEMSPLLGDVASVMLPDEESINVAIQKIQGVIHGLSIEEIEEFHVVEKEEPEEQEYEFQREEEEQYE